MALGKKTGGRRRGIPNKVTREMREMIKLALDEKFETLGEALDEVRFGIEIEKQMPDGQVVVGRLNADPGKYVECLAKLAEYCIPRLGRQELTGADGGPVVVEIVKFSEGE